MGCNSILEIVCTKCFRRAQYPFSKHFRTSFARLKSGWTYGSPVVITLPYEQGEITVGKLAKLANGSAVVKCGDTSVLATVVTSSNPAADSFLPLNVDYKQKASAAGRIPMNFLRRDLSQSQNEILTSRKIDRCLRPLFPENFPFETQISCNLLAYDRHNQPDILAINAASAALAVSNIPWSQPVAAVRVGWIDRKPVLNPSRYLLSQSSLDLVLAATAQRDIVMLEGSATEILSAHFSEAVSFGAKHAAEIQSLLAKLITQVQPDKLVLDTASTSSTLDTFLCKGYKARIMSILGNKKHDKYSRDNALQALRSHAVAAAATMEHLQHMTPHEVSTAFYDFTKLVMREQILTTKTRPDGRKFSEVRPITCEADILTPLHGSSLFQRGQTQVMASVTLDSIDSMAKTDPVAEILVGRSEKNFMLHYQFPQFATGELETKGGGANRREIGHGALAEKSLKPVIPEDFPFTMRVSAEVLESNGSSSMATVCAGSLALLDAGVPLERPVAGVAMGLVSDGNFEPGKYAILTDILGMEDYAGDMDFKIAGTARGITAVQVDVKVPGVPVNVITEIERSAQEALQHILLKMSKCINKPRSDRKASWPCAESVSVPMNQRSKVIGVSGLNLKNIRSVTGVQITLNEDHSFGIFAPNKSALDKAKEMIEELQVNQSPIVIEFGNTYQGIIVELQRTGALVQIHPQMDPVFVRNSQLDIKLIKHSEAAGLPVGSTVYIKYFGADPVTGEDRWSRRALLSAGGFSKSLLPREDNKQKDDFYSHPSKAS